MNKRPNPDDYPAGSIYGYTVDLSKYCDELEEGTAGRDKTILAWLAKSKRQEKKIKKLDAEVELQLDRWVKVGKECIGLKDELKPLRLIKKNADDIIAGYENATIDSEHELATLRQSIDDSTHSRFRIADWLDCDNPPDNWFKEKMYAIVDLKDELESWQETAEGNLNMLKDRDIELATLKQSIDESEVKTMHKDRVEGWHSVYVGHDLDGYDTVKVALLELKDGE